MPAMFTLWVAPSQEAPAQMSDTQARWRGASSDEAVTEAQRVRSRNPVGPLGSLESSPDGQFPDDRAVSIGYHPARIRHDDRAIDRGR